MSHRDALSPEFIESLCGIGWVGDLDEMRRSKIQDWADDGSDWSIPVPASRPSGGGED